MLRLTQLSDGSWHALSNFVRVACSRSSPKIIIYQLVEFAIVLSTYPTLAVLFWVSFVAFKAYLDPFALQLNSKWRNIIKNTLNSYQIIWFYSMVVCGTHISAIPERLIHNHKLLMNCMDLLTYFTRMDLMRRCLWRMAPLHNTFLLLLFMRSGGLRGPGFESKLIFIWTVNTKHKLNYSLSH